MTYDYKNPKPPTIGDGRYKSLPIDCVRVSYYDVFGKDETDVKKQDLSFYRVNEFYSSEEFRITGERYWAKKFGNSNMNKPGMFAVFPEDNKIHDNDNLIEIKFNSSIIRTYSPEKLLKFLDKSFRMITDRDYNLIIIYNNYIKFIHLPYERKTARLINGINPLFSNSQFHSNEYISRFLFDYESNDQKFFMPYISEDIINNLSDKDLEFAMSILEYSNDDRFSSQQQIESSWQLKKHLNNTGVWYK